MVKLQTLMTLLPLLLLSSMATTTATAGSHTAALGRRGLSTYCNPLFGGCIRDQWPFSPINSGNHFISRSLPRHPSLPPVVVPSPPPPLFASFTPPSDYTNPSFSPLVASPPPPGTTIPPVLPQLPPAYGYLNPAPPFIALSFSPPAVVSNLPPIAGKDQPDVFMSPPEQNWRDAFGVPPPPLVPIDSQMSENVGQPVGENASPKAQSPPAA
ncbi:hypothetical protein SSX86_015461 [Deinandra increscens subsp. villosa]|uniref:Uncharacterized protein n=1 Tax=Deinandra increscens subsp. villosa TaxID=3103831 RepID=A0AAP0GYX5_9ASTR